MSADVKHADDTTRAGEACGQVAKSVAGRMAGERDMTARVNEILNRHLAVGLAVGVVRDGRLAYFHGHGLADSASHTRITEDTVFQIASLTKTFTAIAVMQLWEQRLIDLDFPANAYPRAYKVVPAKASFHPATVRHLLTPRAGVEKGGRHAAGRGPGEGHG